MSGDRKLVIAEKPQAAEVIASFLNCTPYEGYFVSDEYIVVPARGHLLELWIKGINVNSLWELPKTEVYFRPRSGGKEQLELIKELASRVDEIIVATDFDREGEVIGYNCVRYIRNDYRDLFSLSPSLIKRAYFNALIPSELEKAFSEAEETYMDQRLLVQGLARTLADTLIGLNLTKALTLRFKEIYSLKQAVSLGRVQSPLLVHIEDKLKSYDVSVLSPSYSSTSVKENWYRYVFISDGEKTVKVSIDFPIHENREIVLKYYKAEEAVEEQATPMPNTNDIMREMGEVLNPKSLERTLESLYLKRYATYPRTESHYLPIDMLRELQNILMEHGLLKESYSADYYPVKKPEEEGDEKAKKKVAITLTPQGLRALLRGELRGDEKVVALYLVSKLQRAMAPPLRLKKIYAVFEAEGEEFAYEWGTEIANPEDAVDFSWFERKPKLKTGSVRVIVIDTIEEEVTSRGLPKLDFRPISDTDLVVWMQERGIGTVATRHIYPSLLRERHYVSEDNLPTSLGELVARIVRKIGISPELTEWMEEEIRRMGSPDDLVVFKDAIVEEVVVPMIDRLRELENDYFILYCPKGHKVDLVNFLSKGKVVLMMRCNECNKWYPL